MNSNLNNWRRKGDKLTEGSRPSTTDLNVLDQFNSNHLPVNVFDKDHSM